MNTQLISEQLFHAQRVIGVAAMGFAPSVENVRRAEEGIENFMAQGAGGGFDVALARLSLSAMRGGMLPSQDTCHSLRAEVCSMLDAQRNLEQGEQFPRMRG